MTTADGPGPTAHAASPPESAIGAAVRSLLRVVRNPDIRALELSWTVGVGVDWAILVVALVVAYDAGGAVAVGLVSLFRMLPAMAVNLLRAGGAAVVAAAIVADQPIVVYLAVAGASAAGALVRPTTLALLPSV